MKHCNDYKILKTTNTVQCSVLQYSALQYSAVNYSALLCTALLFTAVFYTVWSPIYAEVKHIRPRLTVPKDWLGSQLAKTAGI